MIIQQGIRGWNLFSYACFPSWSRAIWWTGFLPESFILYWRGSNGVCSFMGLKHWIITGSKRNFRWRWNTFSKSYFFFMCSSVIARGLWDIQLKRMQKTAVARRNRGIRAASHGVLWSRCDRSSGIWWQKDSCAAWGLGRISNFDSRPA